MCAHTRVYGTLALAAAFIACRDSSTGLRGRAAGRTPSFATASDTSGGSGNQSHFNAHNEFTYTLWSKIGAGGFPVEFGVLNVTRGGPPGDPQTFLYYSIEQCDDAFRCSISDGSGLIPNQDFRVSGKVAQLNTNTDGNPTFSTYGALPPGPISVSWQDNGLSQVSTSGTWERRTAVQLYRETGIARSAWAEASGSVLGFSLVSVPGGIGSSSRVTIDIFRY
jgi:hypothetical protein